MIRVKHLMDRPAEEDHVRVWVESVGLCRDLAEWCRVDHVAEHLGPPAKLAAWFEKHPDGYATFRERYHRHLEKSPFHPALEQLAAAASGSDVTLLHAGDVADENAAMALAEYLAELQLFADND